MEAWQSWTLFGVAATGIGYYYATTGRQKKRGIGWRPFTPQQARARNASKQRNNSRDSRNKEAEKDKLPDDADASAASPELGGSDKPKKRREPKNKQPSKLAQSTAANVNNDAGEETLENDQEDEDNLEFAKQLSDKMTGTSLKKPEGIQNKKARKQAKRAGATVVAGSNKQSQTNGVLPLQETSTASSTTGGDADDDFSSANSADLGATNTTTPSGADISDMLEPTAKGPSVLRLTESANPQPQRQPKPQKPAQEQETKKQRQNRRKREEEKALREEAERQRQKLLENQRRTAREAEGRPAKNGLKNSQLPAKNAWSTTTSNGSANKNTKATSPQHTDLLDTFEEESSVTTGAKAPVNGTPSSNGGTYGSLPSEEEQISMLKELDSDNGWNTVAKGGKKKRPNVPTSGDESSNGAQKTTNEPAVVANGDSVFPKGAVGTSLNAQANGVAKSAKPPNEQGTRGKATRDTIDHSVWNRSNIHEHPDYDAAFPYALTGHPDDSDWAVV